MYEDLVEKFELDLKGLTVLTEVATGAYSATPYIAGEAGAKVFAIPQYPMLTSRTANPNVTIQNEKTPEIIGAADIVTNLGYVRPIDKWFISHMKTTAVIPLMFETWEFRKEDVDLLECGRKGIVILGTNEEHEKLRTIDFVAHLCAKKLYEKGIPIFRSKIAVLGKSRFAKSILNLLFSMGADITDNVCSDLDIIVVADKQYKFTTHSFRDDVVEPGTIPVLRMWKNNHMTWNLTELGSKPVIELNTAGLKVGEIMARLRLKGLSPVETMHEALKNPLCQGWTTLNAPKSMGDFVCAKCGTSYGHMTSLETQKCPNCDSIERSVG